MDGQRRRRPKVYTKGDRQEICRWCGKPFSAPPSSSRVWYCHPCRAMKRREWNATAHANRPPRPEDLERAHEWRDELQQRTLPLATSAGDRWSTVDDRVLVALMDFPIEKTCLALGRSLHAVQGRRNILRKRGVLQSGDRGSVD